MAAERFHEALRFAHKMIELANLSSGAAKVAYLESAQRAMERAQSIRGGAK
jgi:hypothetical protein